MKKGRCGRVVPMLLLITSAYAAEVGPGEIPQGEALPRTSVGQKIFWYMPNRVLDFLDIFRFRIRVGPGWAAHVRATDYGAFYAGDYDAVYIGLPGPRLGRRMRSPVGRESLTGLILTGVDATDDTPHGPEYGAAEFNAGVHLGWVGIEVGIDPSEILVFLKGWFGFDLTGEDDPRRPRPDPERMTRGLSIGPGKGVFELDPKPVHFESWRARLDYLEENVPRRISEPIRAADAYFAYDPDDVLVPPQIRLRIKLFSEVMQGRDFEFRVEPDLEWEVEFPNLERRVRLFFETARSDEVYGSDLPESEDRGLHIGMRKWITQLNLSADAGVRAAWPPQPFARVVWTKDFEPHGWRIRPVQRFILNRDDGLASVSTLHVSRWLGAQHTGILVQSLSGKWTTENPDWKWLESVALVRVNRLLDETRRGRMATWQDTMHATGWQYILYGEGDTIQTHRTGVFLRRPLYRQWVCGEMRTGMEWDRADDFSGSFFVHMGVDMRFWGTARE